MVLPPFPQPHEPDSIDRRLLPRTGRVRGDLLRIPGGHAPLLEEVQAYFTITGHSPAWVLPPIRPELPMPGMSRPAAAHPPDPGACLAEPWPTGRGVGGGDVPVPGALQVSPVTPLALPCPVAAWCDPGPVRLPTTPSRTLPTPYTRPAGRQRPRVGQVRAALLAASSATRATRVRRGDVLASKGQDTRPWLFSSRHLYTAVRRCAPVSSARQFRRGWSHPARGLQSSPWWSG